MDIILSMQQSQQLLLGQLQAQMLLIQEEMTKDKTSKPEARVEVLEEEMVVEPEPQRDKPEEVEVDRDSYRAKLQLVGKLLQLDTKVESQSKNFAMSVDAGEATTRNKLPASANFAQEFDKWLSELKGEEGSVRAKKKQGEPFQVGQFPKRVHLKMSSYEIADCPWKVNAQGLDRQLLESVLYFGKEEPQIKVKGARLRDWETSIREMLSVLSYMDMFTAAAIEIMKATSKRVEEDASTSKIVMADIVAKLKDTQESTLVELKNYADNVYMLKQDVWNDSQDAMGLLHSAGIGMQDCVKNAVDVIASSMVTRRDAWLEKVKSTLTKEGVLRLRQVELNADKLFGKEACEAALEEARDERRSKVEDTFLNKAVSSKENTGNVAKPKDTGFQRKAFQQNQPQKQPYQQQSSTE